MMRYCLGQFVKALGYKRPNFPGRSGLGIFNFAVYFSTILLILSANARAQLKIKIEHLGTEDGLSHDVVNSIIKDRDGFIWFGTRDGINRYDGHSIVVYKAQPGDRSELKSNWIDAIFEDPAGLLWLKVRDDQIYTFNKKTETFSGISAKILETKNQRTVFDRVILSYDGAWLTAINKGVFFIPRLSSSTFKYTAYGINQKDGFKLPSNQITFIHPDKDHGVWIGTAKGLCYLKKAGNGQYQCVDLNYQLISGPNFRCIAEDDEHVYTGTVDGYLLTYQKSTKTFTGKLKLTNDTLNAICVSKKSKIIYITTSGGAIIRIDVATNRISQAAMPGAHALLLIYEDRNGILWLEPQKHGVIKYDPLTHKFKYFFQPNDADAINPAKSYGIFEDNQGVLWANMKGGGFGYYNTAKDSIAYFYDKPGATDRKFSNMIYCHYLDAAGVLWLSSGQVGVNKVIFQQNDFERKLLIEGSADRSDNEVRGLCNDRKHRLWAGSKSGKLLVYDEQKRVNIMFTNLPVSGFGQIYNLLQDDNGAIWVATKGNGLFRLDPIDLTETQYQVNHYLNNKKDPNSISSNIIYSLLKDKHGRIWTGSFDEGINLIVSDGKNITFKNAENTFVHYPKNTYNKVRNLTEDNKGNIWVSTTDGLLVFNPDEVNPRFKGYSKVLGNTESLGNNDVQCVYKDSKNNMWVATSGGGLNLAVGNNPLAELKFKVFGITQGLPSDFIISMVEDNLGNLLLATENGLSKFNIDKRLFRNYDAYDGLAKTNFSESSAIKLYNGSIVFGTLQGYLTFSPDKISDHPITAPMVLTHLQINNKEVLPDTSNSVLKTNLSNTDHIVLKYDNSFSITFTVLDYRSSNKPMYTYRLKGFKEEWSDTSNQRKATYTNLPPGKYVFEVKSTSSNLYTNTPYKSLTITIAPPLWRTSWAYLFYLMAAIILVVIIRRTIITMLTLRNRIAVEQRMSNLKLSFFTNISHELRTPLTLILNPIEEIARHESLSLKGRENIQVVSKNATRMVRFINQLLDIRKVESGAVSLKISYIEVISFVKMIGSYFDELAREKDIRLSVNSSVIQLYVWADAEKLDIVIYNLLSNAFKFSPDHHNITVEINADEQLGNYSISVTDEGIGVPEKELTHIFELYYEVEKNEGTYLKGTGIGLALSKELITLHHGSISANNNTNGGLTVTIKLHLGQDYFKGSKYTFAPPAELVVNEPEQLIERDITQPATDNPDKKPQILLVEDNSELRRFLTGQLSGAYRVETADNGEEGLNKAKHLIPDLVLSDVMMPKMSGIQMLDKLKNNPVTSHIPVILLTAKFSVESQMEGLKYGADGYITKPFKNDFLMASIANLLTQRRKLFEALINHKTIVLSPGEIVITSRDEAFLQQVIKNVETGMSDPDFNIDAVSKSVGMSRTNFFRKFKSLTNMAPVEFVRQMRLKRGKQLLDAGETNIQTIAYTVGFHNAKYFSTCFKDEYQMTPTEYLKSKG